MKTNDLIQALSADGLVPRRLLNSTALLVGGLGFIIAAFMFFEKLPVRHYLMTYGFNPTVMKFGFTFAVIIAAAAVMLANARPSAKPSTYVNWLLLPVAILAAYLIYDYAQLGAERFEARLWGFKNWLCVFSIIWIAVLPLLGLLWALTQTAPRQPGLVGIAAGMASGGAAATVYALHCTNDSPLFLVWYVLAIAVTATLGGILAKQVLVW